MTHTPLLALLVFAACGSGTKPTAQTVSKPTIGACQDQGRLSVTMRSTQPHHRVCFVPEGEEIALRVGADKKPDLSGEKFWHNTWESLDAVAVKVDVDGSCVAHLDVTNDVPKSGMMRISVALKPDGTATGTFENKSYEPGREDEACTVPLAGTGSFK